MAKITEQTRDDMFTAWQEKQAVQYVSTKLRISRTTVRAYREKDKWDERFAKIKAKALQKADDEAAKRRARHIALAKLLQTAGQKYFVTEEGTVKRCKSTMGAITAIQYGVRMEREAVGEPGETSEQKITIEYVGDDNPNQ